MTKRGKYQVTFSIPWGDTFVAFSVDNIMDLGNARMIERALLDGGCTSVYLSIGTANKDQPLVALLPNDFPPGHVSVKVSEALARFRGGLAQKR